MDIDLDYLVRPVNKIGTNNVRMYKNDYCIVDNVEYFVNNLVKNGFLICSDKKFFTNHRKSYTYWWIKKKKDMTLIHIDAHSDLYGNSLRDLTLLSDIDMGCDNYIWYGIRDGYISKIYWVVPDGLYDLSDPELACRFLGKNILACHNYVDGRLLMKMNVKTRTGDKVIDYTVCTLDKLPEINGVELLTVATSPEFTPEEADAEIFKALELLGASDEEFGRIKKLHFEMNSDYLLNLETK